ncbi:hypothetical protein ACJMK2_041616 [Sinanodonta woodiana]|uniref:G-protein coupled receptors family 1 profile domain-containing protein n=1 Tax=Sinanodonta woodiana TaxID=1069815 RepID=A0ABD3W4U5_SINWO
MSGFHKNSTSIFAIDISSSNISNLSDNGLQRLTFSDKVTDEIIFVTECFLSPIISFIGLIGNVFSIAVLLHTKIRTTTSVCLAALAVSNSLFLITNTLWKSSGIIKRFDIMLYYEYYAYGFSVLFYMKTSFSRISSWLIVAIASEKMVAVTFPLKVKNFFTIKNMLIFVVIISTLTFLFLSPLCLKYTVGYMYDRRLKTVRAYLNETDYYRENRNLFDNYINYFLVIAFRYLPMALVVVINTQIGTALLKNRRSRQMAFPNNKKFAVSEEEHRITIVLVTVVTSFIICLLPGNIHVAVTMAVDGYNLYGKFQNLYIAMGNISLLLEVVNSSVIFFIYMTTSKQFIKTFKLIFCRCTAKLQATVAPDSFPKVKLLMTQPNVKKISSLEVPSTSMTISTVAVPDTTLTMLALEVRCTTSHDNSIQTDPTLT